MVPDEVLNLLERLSAQCDPPPWSAVVEGRDQLAGDSFIRTGTIADRREDIYVTRDGGPADATHLDLIAAARTYLPELAAEVRASRERTPDLLVGGHVRYPSPDDPARAPVWDNYVVAQVTQASLGSIPRNTLAFGVMVDGLDVRLIFQLRALDHEDQEDMQDIVSELEAYLGSDVRVNSSHDIREWRSISPHDGVRWVYLARFDGD